MREDSLGYLSLTLTAGHGPSGYWPYFVIVNQNTAFMWQFTHELLKPGGD